MPHPIKEESFFTAALRWEWIGWV